MSKEETVVYEVEELDNYMVTEVLRDVRDALEEKGYDAITQLSGYLISGDLAYISSYKGARKSIQKLDRESIVETLLNNYLKDVK
jgi:uncharacterized protein (UPF0297 family)